MSASKNCNWSIAQVYVTCKTIFFTFLIAQVNLVTCLPRWQNHCYAYNLKFLLIAKQVSLFLSPFKLKDRLIGRSLPASIIFYACSSVSFYFKLHKLIFFPLYFLNTRTSTCATKIEQSRHVGITHIEPEYSINAPTVNLN